MDPKFCLGVRVSWARQEGYVHRVYVGTITSVHPAGAHGGISGQLQDEVTVTLDNPIAVAGRLFKTVGGPIGQFKIV